MANFQIQYSAPGTNPIISGPIAVSSPAAGSFSHLAPMYAAIPNGWQHNNSTGLFEPTATSWVNDLTYSLAGQTGTHGISNPWGGVSGVTTLSALQTAMNSAAYGDVIVIAAGAAANIIGQTLTIPAKTWTSGWIYVVSSTVLSGAFSPVAGSPLLNSHLSSGQMATVTFNTDQRGLETIGAPSHWRFVGIDFRLATTVAINYATCYITGGEYLVWDRCCIRQLGTYLQSECRGIYFDGTAHHCAFLECRIGPCLSRNVQISDTQAMLWANQTDHDFYMRNLWVCASGMCWMSGGAGVGTPSDFVWDGCHFYQDPTWPSAMWNKNNVEIKKMSKMIMQRCIETPQSGDNQNGQCFTICTTEQNAGGDPTATVRDLHIRWCRLDAGLCPGAAMQVHARCNNNPTLGERWEILQVKMATPANYFYQLGGSQAALRVEYTTGFPVSRTINCDNLSFLNSRWCNNISQHGTYGLTINDTNTNLAGLTRTNNVIAGGNAGNFGGSGNFYPATVAAIQMVNYAAGDWRLASTSPYKGTSSHGFDPGCADAVLASYLVGVESERSL